MGELTREIEREVTVHRRRGQEERRKSREESGGAMRCSAEIGEERERRGDMRGDL